MATVNNGEFTISHVSMEKVLDGTPCGSAICFSTKILITQNWLFLVKFPMFFSSLVFFKVYTIRLMRLPKVFSKVLIKTSNKRISSHSTTNSTFKTKN